MKTHPDYTASIECDNLNDLEVDDFEKYYILINNSFADNNTKGLNLTVGGQGYHTISAETRAKISKSSMGKVISAEARAKLRAANIQYPVRCVETGKSYNNSHDAGRATNIEHANINRACKKHWTAGGYH